ncbi:hypothetical protein [Amycolatopsis sp. cmx-4-83]|uniref:hypothetical protein n=1 Tax=Amycolatopsis sp. cmx-4-83 TaxID=2790940 RepID=UPI0039785BF2
MDGSRVASRVAGGAAGALPVSRSTSRVASTIVVPVPPPSMATRTSPRPGVTTGWPSTSCVHTTWVSRTRGSATSSSVPPAW